MGSWDWHEKLVRQATANMVEVRSCPRSSRAAWEMRLMRGRVLGQLYSVSTELQLLSCRQPSSRPIRD